MVRRSLEERIEELENRKRSLVARQRKERRAADTRRKVLVGSLMLDRIKGDGDEAVRLRAWLRRELPEFVTRDIDRRVVADLIGDAADSGAVGAAKAGAEPGTLPGAQAGKPGGTEGRAQAGTPVGAEDGAKAGADAGTLAGAPPDAEDGAEPRTEDGGRNPATLL